MYQIIKRYIKILKIKINDVYPDAIIITKPLEGDEMNDLHLLWMLQQICFNKHQSETKKHRWLGYVQGIMISKGYINVLEERELTRPYLNGK